MSSTLVYKIQIASGFFLSFSWGGGGGILLSFSVFCFCLFVCCCVQEIVPTDGGGVMVWRSIRGQEMTLLVIVNGNLTAQHYTDDSLRPTHLPLLQLHRCVAVACSSPDLSPTEHLWYVIDRHVRQHPHPPATNKN